MNCHHNKILIDSFSFFDFFVVVMLCKSRLVLMKLFSRQNRVVLVTSNMTKMKRFSCFLCGFIKVGQGRSVIFVEEGGEG